MARRSAAPQRSVRRIIAERFAVALIFGALVNLILSFPSTSQLPLIAKVRQDGAGLGMQLSTLWNDMLSPSGVERPEGTTPLAIFDLDEPACQALAGYQKCRFDRVGHPEVLDAALAAADTSGAKVIVLDILLPTAREAASSEAGRRLRARLEGPGPPVVAPILFGNNSIGDISIDWANSICGRERCGRLRLAPAFVIDRFGSARNYPLRLNALVAGAGADGQPGSGQISSLVQAAADAAGTPSTNVPDPLPILFTFPSFASLLDPADQDLLVAQTGKYLNSVTYQHLDVSEDGKGYAMPARPGMIVIIGSTAPITGDWHETPLGKMAGMEVVANAIRTHQMLAAKPVNGGIDWVGWTSMILAWLILLATIVAITRIQQHRARFAFRVRLPGRTTPLLLGYSAVLVLAVVTLAFLFEMIVRMWDLTSHLADPYARTGDVDLIFPLVAIFFTTAVDLSHRLIQRLEHGVRWAIDQVSVRLRP